MGSNRKIARLEEAQRRALVTFEAMGHKPNEGELAGAILIVLEELDAELDEPEEGGK